MGQDNENVAAQLNGAALALLAKARRELLAHEAERGAQRALQTEVVRAMRDAKALSDAKVLQLEAELGQSEVAVRRLVAKLLKRFCSEAAIITM